MRLNCLLVPLICCIAHAQPQPPPERYVLVRCGRLLAVPDAKTTNAAKGVRENVTLVIHNAAIESIHPGLSGPDLSAKEKAGAAVTEIDLRDKFVLPGLIDCHVHLSSEYDPTVHLRRVTESDAAVAVRATVFARRNLEAGFTTVRDVGDRAGVAFALRDAVRDGLIVGPRILASGKSVSVTGGHGDYTNGYRADVWAMPTPEDGVADGPDACMQAVRHQIKMGADLIKITATGGVLSVSGAGLAQHFNDEELAAIVHTAHAMGRKVAAHAHGTDGIIGALRAGVDSIEHGTYLDDEAIRLFKEKGTYYVPTILAGATVARNADVPGYYLPVVAAKAREAGPKILDAVRRAHAAGVKIAFGTDTGVSRHGDNAKEFALMVQAGMTPLQAIEAATRHAADLCGLAEELGTLEPGKAADVIAVEGDPLRNVSALEHVTFVMHAGIVHKAPAP